MTFELSCCKFPKASELAKEWSLNKESLLQFMEATHWGIHGSVVDSETKQPIHQVNLWVTFGGLIAVRAVFVESYILYFICQKGLLG